MEAQRLELRLYVAAAAPNSAKAESNLRRLLADRGVSDYRLEVVDCVSSPRRALDDGILVTPTLLKLAPEPACTLVGTLGNAGEVAGLLGLPAASAGEVSRG